MPVHAVPSCSPGTLLLFVGRTPARPVGWGFVGLGLSLPLWLQGHCLLASCEVPQPRFLLERGSPSPGAACMTPAGGPGRARTAVFACRVLREPEAGVTERELPGACVHAAGRRAVCCLRGRAGGRSVSGGPGARMPMAVTPFLQSELTVLPEDLGEREKCQGRREDAPRHLRGHVPAPGPPCVSTCTRTSRASSVSCFSAAPPPRPPSRGSPVRAPRPWQRPNDRLSSGHCCVDTVGWH